MCIFGGGQADNGAAQARADQQANEARLNAARTNINGAFSKFDDSYYKKLGNDYIDYATPQVNDQFLDAQKQLTYALSRGGNLNSSVAADQYANLGKQMARNEQGVQGQALDLENQQRQTIEGNRSDVLNQFSTAGSSGDAAAAALARTNAVSAPPAFSPLGNLFTNGTAILANRANLTGNPSIPIGNLGARLFGGGSSSQVVH